MHPVVHEPFSDTGQEQTAHRLGMWAFLASEILLFAGLITLYAAYRVEGAEGFREASGHLYQSIGIGNTVVLLASSFAMARAVRAAHAGRRGRAAVLMLVTAGLGMVFLGVKGVEYWLDAKDGILPLAGLELSEFVHPEGADRLFTMYLAMTGVHALHLLTGVGVVVSAAVLVWRGKVRVGPTSPVEAIGLYWHFVDIVWVFLLPLLYFA